MTLHLQITYYDWPTTSLLQIVIKILGAIIRRDQMWPKSIWHQLWTFYQRYLRSSNHLRFWNSCLIVSASRKALRFPILSWKCASFSWIEEDGYIQSSLEMLASLYWPLSGPRPDRSGDGGNSQKQWRQIGFVDPCVTSKSSVCRELHIRQA